MSVGERVQECINKLEANDPENAFIQLAIAIDGTAKKEYPGKKTSARCKAFIRENLPFIFWSLTNGTPSTCKDFKLELSNNEEASAYVSFEDVVYSILRCSLLHEGEMPQKVTFTTEEVIRIHNGKMHFPVAMIGSLLFSVIASPVNENQKVSNNTHFVFGKVRAPVNDMWGDVERTKELIRNGFQYDVEKLIKSYGQTNITRP